MPTAIGCLPNKDKVGVKLKQIFDLTYHHLHVETNAGGGDNPIGQDHGNNHLLSLLFVNQAHL